MGNNKSRRTCFNLQTKVIVENDTKMRFTDDGNCSMAFLNCEDSAIRGRAIEGDMGYSATPLSNPRERRPISLPLSASRRREWPMADSYEALNQDRLRRSWLADVFGTMQEDV